MNILSFWAIALWTGCAAPQAHYESDPICGRVYLFPGVEGGPWVLGGVRRAMREAGYTGEIRDVTWDRPIGGLCNLVDMTGNLERAARLADEIVEFRQKYPEAPVDLVGYSGGGGLALFTAEAIPPGKTIRNLILVQPAVGRERDLTIAIERITGELHNFYSEKDWLVLGLGTSVFGNMDRTYGPAAGKLGFDLEAAVPDPRLRDRVRQVAWHSDMSATGHGGGHVAAIGRHWNRIYVAPLIADQAE